METCIISIASSFPYDTSKFVNNPTQYYQVITYHELLSLHNFMDLTKDIDQEVINEITPKKISKIINYFRTPSIKIIFRFLCSQDCNNGNYFVDNRITSQIFDFVKLVTRRNCIIELSDHSMGAFFNNWNDEFMEMKKPIEILPINHCGRFKMYGSKQKFTESVHPTLIQIGNLSSSEDIEIIFNNSPDTKVFNIISDDVKLLSKGIQVTPRSTLHVSKAFSNVLEDLEVPVHCEFNYQCGVIIVSSTHWCNLNSVENSVNLDILHDYCTDILGLEANMNLERSLSLAKDEQEYKRLISNTVRQLSSGEINVSKRIKMDDDECVDF